MSSNDLWKIPAEIRACNNWVCWRYEWRQGSTKPTKVPHSPRTGQPCDVKDASQHASFQDAIQALYFQEFDGLGFCFTDDNPYSGIDLDDPYQVKPDGSYHFKDPARQTEIQNAIFEKFISYAEKSPSKKGLHIIVKGKIPGGFRRESIEVYSSMRYFTMTGDVFRDAPVNECQELLTILYDEMKAPEVNASDFTGSFGFEHTDAEIIEKAANAANGDLFQALFNGEWERYYSSQSEADFALIDIVAFYTDNKFQVAQIFRQSALGKRDKAQRNDYVSNMVNKSFDHKLPPIDASGLMNEIAAAQAARSGAVTFPSDTDAAALPGGAAHNPTSPGTAAGSLRPLAAPSTGFETDNHFRKVWPTGMLGRVVDFIYRSSPRPVYEVSLMAGLAFLSGITGRAYNVSSTGLNNYYLVLAATGSGKEAAAVGIGELINEVTSDGNHASASQFIGPADLASGQALLRYMSEGHLSFLSLIGEFGIRLNSLSHDNASTSDRQLLRVLLDLFNKSGRGQSVMPTVYADSQKNTDPIKAPAFTILGESTQSLFFPAINEDTVNSGLIPRFIIVEYNGGRPVYNETHANVSPAHDLIAWLRHLTTRCMIYIDKNDVYDIPCTPEGEQRLRQLNKDCDALIDQSYNETAKNLWSRVHLKTWKIAGLLAISDDMNRPIIDVGHVEWAMSLVVEATQKIAARFDLGSIGMRGNDLECHTSLHKAIADWLNVAIKDRDLRGFNYKGSHVHSPLRVKGIIPYTYLFKRLSNRQEYKSHRLGAKNAVRSTLDIMFSEGVLQQVNKAQADKEYNLRCDCYAVVDPAYFIGD